MSSSLLALALAGALLVQVSSGGVGSLIIAVAGDSVAEKLRGRALGVIYTVGDFGAAIGPSVALSLLGLEYFTLPMIYRASAGFLLLTALVGWWQGRKK
jgi:hypothetical protein